MNDAAAHVLIVEDETKIGTAVRDYLAANGYRVTLLETGAGAVDWIREHAPDAVLLDVMLPGDDGLSICRNVRVFSNVPILMVTARIEEIDRLLGLEFGADDYLCKPFSLRELVLRLKAVLRRALPDAGTTSAVTLDADRFEARVHGHALALTPVEFRLLRRLMEKPGKVYSRDQLLAVLYEDHRVVSDRTVDSHIRNLRKKFAGRGLDPIASVYGVGFRFEL